MLWIPKEYLEQSFSLTLAIHKSKQGISVLKWPIEAMGSEKINR